MSGRKEETSPLVSGPHTASSYHSTTSTPTTLSTTNTNKTNATPHDGSNKNSSMTRREPVDDNDNDNDTAPTAAVEIKSYAKAREAFRKRDIQATRAEHAKKGPAVVDHQEHHGGGGDFVKSIVFGGLDGIITTFAIIAAAAGSNEDYKAVLIFGFANVIADAFSMGFGEFVSGSAERSYALKEREREEWEVENCPDVEIAEMIELYMARGISEEDATTMVNIISKDPKVFVDFMMIDELQLLVDLEDKYGPAKQGVVMFFSFVCFGIVPLLAYVGGKGKGTDYIFGISVALTAVSLMLLGAVKGYLTSMNITLSALLMLFNGCVSGGVSYGVGVLIEHIVNRSA